MATSRDPDLRPADAGQFLRAITGARSGLPLVGPAAALPPGQAADPSAAETAVPRTATPPGGWPPPPAAPPGGGSAWPAQPGRDALDLIPGMAAPAARQSYGAPRDGTGPMSTQHYLPEPYRPATHKTLIVTGADAPYGAVPPADREPRLQQLLFSRRLGYLALAVAAIVVIGVLGWWVMAGRYTTVPKVAGLPAAAARTNLSDAGLTPVTGKTRFDNQVARGLVISTTPAAGARLVRGGRVTLLISAGPNMITMPQVTGQPLSAAQAAIKHAGLVPGKVTLVPSATIGAGIVIATHPSAGASWPQPEPVTLTVSSGPPIPNFVGQPKAAAEGWAAANGVSLNEVTAHSSDQPAGTVIRQAPAAGSAFSKGQVITIDISPGPPMVNIPNVDGMRIGEAIRTLQGLAFQVQVNQVGPFNTVFAYSPSGQAPEGSTITLETGLPHFG
jgi:serine/threonine-protein kinase